MLAWESEIEDRNIKYQYVSIMYSTIMVTDLTCIGHNTPFKVLTYFINQDGSTKYKGRLLKL